MRRCTLRFQRGNTPPQQRAHACDADSWPRDASQRTLRTPPILQEPHPQSVAPATNQHQPVDLLVGQSPTVPSWAAMERHRDECVQRFRHVAVWKAGSPNIYASSTLTARNLRRRWYGGWCGTRAGHHSGGPAPSLPAAARGVANDGIRGLGRRAAAGENNSGSAKPPPAQGQPGSPCAEPRVVCPRSASVPCSPTLPGHCGALQALRCTTPWRETPC